MKSFSEDALASDSLRPLWRLELGKRDPEIYILSSVLPDVAHIVEQAGRVNDDFGVKTADYTPVIESIQNGKRFRFRVPVNPVTRTKGDTIPHITPKHQSEWFARFAERKGFSVEPDELIVSGSESHRFKGSSETISLASATFEGILEVTDSNEFSNWMRQGFGRGKAYGLGLMTIIDA